MKKDKFNRNNWNHIESDLDSSQLHCKIRDILRMKDYKAWRIWQEVPLSDLMETKEVYFFDFFIEDINLCIEVQGQQHYKPTQYGGISALEAMNRFSEQQKRDNRKKYLLEDNGYSLLCLSYKEVEKIDSKLLIGRITDVIRQREC